MKRQRFKKQALITGLNDALVRGLGFLMRLWVSRQLGAEALGVMELASGAHMLALTPAAAGLPGAVSRLTAKGRTEEERQMVLLAGRQLCLRLSLVICPCFLLLAGPMAHLLGDTRTLPSLVCFAPCVFFIGLSSVYDGACYGRGNAWPPAISEMTEQLVRMGAVFLLLGLLPRLTIPWRAAMPALAGMLGEGAGLMVMLLLYGPVPRPGDCTRLPALRRRLSRLSLPLMLSRLSHTGLRTLCGVLIPLRLMACGLARGEAMSRLGMLNGMAMPLMLLPGLLSGALATVGAPAIARCKNRGQEGRLALRLCGAALGCGVFCAGALYGLAPVIAARLYRLPEVALLIRALCPMAVILPLQQVLGGLMTGLGLQKKSLVASLLGALATLLCTWQWAGRANWHIFGAGYAQLAGHGLSLFCLLIFFLFRGRAIPRTEGAMG